VRLFDPDEITRFHASEKYTVFWKDGREYLLDESLSQLEERLADHGFFRCHRKELVNLRHVRAMRSELGLTRVGLSDGQAADVSRRVLPELKRRLGIA
jgi:DNA-binding LytR/AlgR family response regulator